jgi:DNA-binding MurR/RpiR family transcriptional regulator
MNSQNVVERFEDYSAYGVSTALNSVFHESERALSVITPRDLGYIVDEIKSADVVLTCSDGKSEVLPHCCAARLRALGVRCEELKPGTKLQPGEQALLIAWFGTEPNDSVLKTISDVKRRGGHVVTFLTRVDTPCARISDHVVLIASDRQQNQRLTPRWRESSFERASLLTLDALTLVLSDAVRA